MLYAKWLTITIDDECYETQREECSLHYYVVGEDFIKEEHLHRL